MIEESSKPNSILDNLGEMLNALLNSIHTYVLHSDGQLWRLQDNTQNRITTPTTSVSKDDDRNRNINVNANKFTTPLDINPNKITTPLDINPNKFTTPLDINPNKFTTPLDINPNKSTTTLSRNAGLVHIGKDKIIEELED
eukprot:106523_1